MDNSRWFWPDTLGKLALIWAVIMVMLYVLIITFHTWLYGPDNVDHSMELTSLVFVGGPSLWIGLAIVKSNLKMQRQLRVLASTDELTELCNRRAFFEQADRLATKSGGLLVVLDADFFKQINDTFGHHAGDQTLTQIARHLRGSTRTGDILGRLGGEEFGLFLPATAPAQARPILTRLCSGITLPHADGRRLTLSAGAAAIVPGGSMDQTFRHADEALYAAKRMGRKRFVFAQDQEPPRTATTASARPTAA